MVEQPTLRQSSGFRRSVGRPLNRPNEDPRVFPTVFRIPSPVAFLPNECMGRRDSCDRRGACRRFERRSGHCRRGSSEMPRRRASVRGARPFGGRCPRVRSRGRPEGARRVGRQDRRRDGHEHGLHDRGRLRGGLYAGGNRRDRRGRRLGQDACSPHGPRQPPLARKRKRLSGTLVGFRRNQRPRRIEAPRSARSVAGALALSDDLDGAG